MDRRVLNFRAFFLALGYDIDYTLALNLLVGFGYEKLGESGFSESILERIGRHVGLDEESKKAISSEWAKWQKSVRPSPPSHATKEKREPIYGHCVKCYQARKMKDTHEVTLKNGRTAIQGTCPVCGTKMTHFSALENPTGL